jgi:uncharacterized protein
MRRSTRSFLFPDVNVWIALTYRAHKHYFVAKSWLDSLLDYEVLCFCRVTQLGFLRLLTTPAVMENQTRSQAEAWAVYDDWLQNGRAEFIEEPPGIEPAFRALTQSGHAAPKDWGDSYISAFAQTSGLKVVTFDQALHRRTANSLLLGP